MMLNFGASPTIFIPRRFPIRTMCLASSINTEQLRAQLDQLHSEAEKARAKANNARLRLMRLSEAAAKLQRQAVVSVQTGKENDARELLFQKKKVMQALEKSKARIELLDELSGKLNEVISARETQLVGNISLDLEVDREDTSAPVRIVSPKQEYAVQAGNNGDSNTDLLKFSDDQEFQVCVQDQADLPTNKDPNNSEGSFQVYAQGQQELTTDDEPNYLEGSLLGNENDVLSSLKGISSYEAFLEHLDQQLNKIEVDLVTVVRFSTLILGGEERSKNLKVQQTMEILEAVRCIRERIAGIMVSKVEIR